MFLCFFQVRKHLFFLHALFETLEKEALDFVFDTVISFSGLVFQKTKPDQKDSINQV